MELRRGGKSLSSFAWKCWLTKTLNKQLRLGMPKNSRVRCRQACKDISFSTQSTKPGSSMEDFENASVRLIDTIKSYQDRVTIIISTRPHAWGAQADPAMLTRCLGLPNMTETANLESGTSDRYSFHEALEAYATQEASKKMHNPSPLFK